MKFLEDQKWVLTERELFRLFAMVRRQMMNMQQGEYADATRALCERHGIEYEELAAHARLLCPSVDYRELMWLSDNRMSDPVIRQKLLGNG
jgi:hypothetical protein